MSCGVGDGGVTVLCDADDTGGLKLSSQTRSALMSRLAGEAPVLPPPPGPPGETNRKSSN